MAIFNYSNDYSKEVQEILKSETTDLNYIKFIITGDSHIISHGVDFTPWSTDGSYGTNADKYWDIKYLPIDNADTPSNNGLWTSKTISEKISTITGTIADGMHFRGTISVDSDNKYSVNKKTAGNFPAGVIGDTYRIETPGSYAGNNCEAGDLLICVASGISYSSTSETETKATWTVAQTNINGIVYHKINNVSRGFYSNDTKPFEIYAPTVAGTKGYLLISEGDTNTPTWTDQTDITAGKVKSSLSLNTNTGLKWTDSTTTTYDGSVAATIGMDLASYDGFGTIKGDKNTVTISNGVLSLTSDNILNALKLSSIASVNTWRGIKTYSSSGWSDFLGNGPDTNSLGFKFGSGTTLVSKTDSDNKVSYISFNVNTNYTTDTTDTTNRNYAVKVDASNTDNNNQLYVNVPWVNTTYSVVTNLYNGLVPQLKATDGNINSVEYKVLCYNSETNPVWKKLPANAFLNTWRTITWGGTNIGSNALTVTGSGHTTVSVNSATGAAVIESSWRDIQVGGNSIGDNTLNFMPTGSVYVIKNDQNTGIYDVGFDIAWYNMSTKKYECEYNQ